MSVSICFPFFPISIFLFPFPSFQCFLSFLSLLLPHPRFVFIHFLLLSFLCVYLLFLFFCSPLSVPRLPPRNIHLFMLYINPFPLSHARIYPFFYLFPVFLFLTWSNLLFLLFLHVFYYFSSPPPLRVLLLLLSCSIIHYLPFTHLFIPFSFISSSSCPPPPPVRSSSSVSFPAAAPGKPICSPHHKQ